MIGTGAETLAGASGRVDRASAQDLLPLAADSTRAPMQVAAVLVLGAGAPPSLQATREALTERIRAVPRLRQRLVRTPPGCGRPVWIDDPRFDLAAHVGQLTCRAPGDEQALLDAAAHLVTAPLPRSRPLWSATLVTGLAGGCAALVVVFHHVLADGIGGLAILARLVDGIPSEDDAEFPRQAPTNGALFRAAFQDRLRALVNVPAAYRRVRGGARELGTERPSRAPRCSLNQPTGPRRRVSVAHTELAAVRGQAHRHGGTVNDVLLSAVGGALGTLLRRRGEDVDAVVISVPISARQTATTAHLGNEVGVMPVSVPTLRDPVARLTATVAVTRNRKTASRGASATLLAPAFRALAGLGLFRWFVDHQHLVNTFVTNLRGPDFRLSFLDATITEVIAVPSTTGNVTVSFAALSYAGTITVSVLADPDHCPDLPLLRQELQRELDVLTTATG